jgi:hypothetical protein
MKKVYLCDTSESLTRVFFDTDTTSVACFEVSAEYRGGKAFG